MITSKDFPLCSRLGVLRKTTGGNLAISTGALYRELGWEKYRKFMPYMKHEPPQSGYVTPDSCERFLETLNGKP